MITTTCRVNNDQTITTPVGKFLVMQRNAGYIDNDGRWLVHQQPELFWDSCGVLCQRRAGAFLGVFDTPELAETAIASAEPRPERVEMAL